MVMIRLYLFVLLSACIPAAISQPADPVNIGLLIQDKTSLAAKQGAELAVRIANKNGGLNGRPFQLVVKSMEGPWGTGSKQAVDLIWNHKVWALIGSHDGRNAHLVEQAATRSIVVFLSAWSSDPTLSQAFVPWFFNCVPNDRQQADALVDEICKRRKLSGIATISDNAYDSNLAFKNFMMSLKEAGKPQPVHFQYEDFSSQIDELADQINKKNIKAVAMFCSPATTLKLIRLFGKHGISIPLFSTLSVFDENVLTESGLKECRAVLSVPQTERKNNNRMLFYLEYKKKYGKAPGMVASFTFDATNTMIEAIRIAESPDREKLQQALYSIHHEGVTGTVHFDDKGNRKGQLVVSSLPEN
ncbi:MAG: ABC transporter substrate-binding protein [Bacteroidales bacterium]|nr:ABC transporter substrate-binding protein [Bacteroidales bacterium]